MKLITPRSVKLFILLAFVMTVSAGLVYVVAQQNYRQNANDPQIEYAEGLASQFSKSTTIPAINTTIDIANSLSSFVAVYDAKGVILQSSGVLNNKPPVIPAGVFDSASKTGQDRITWQPQAGVRVALVVIHYQGTQSGYVAVGRSLREVESRISMLGIQVFSAWLAGIIGLIILMFAGEMLLSRYFPQ